MKLSDYAKSIGISYRTAWNWYKSGKLQGYQTETGTIIVPDAASPVSPDKSVIYARVSSHKQKDDLDAQAQRLVAYCEAKGIQVSRIVKEIASGVNDTRPKLTGILEDITVTRIVVEHKDRLTRVGFNYIDIMLRLQGRSVEVANLAEDDTHDLLEDLSAIVYSFCARLYGLRRAKYKAERAVQVIAGEEDNV